MPIIGNPIYQSAFVVDQFSGNGSTVAFTMSVAPAGVTNVLVSVSGVLQDPSTYGVVGNTITFSAAPPSGTGNISCRYLGIPVTGVTTTAYRTVTEFTATASQTTFTPPSYTVGFINVYLNGVLLGSADYTATNGTTVVLATGASAGNLVTVESFLVSSVLNAIPNTAGSILLSGSVVTGILPVANGGTGVQYNASYLVVGGGGGGGPSGGGGAGGGGAGGFLTGTVPLSTGAVYTVTVGAGGAGGTGGGSPVNNGSNGGNSSISNGFNAITAFGGGGGGGNSAGGLIAGSGGGSGGGGGGCYPNTGSASGGSAIPGQGFIGGSGYQNNGATARRTGGGGGGSGSIGLNGTSTDVSTQVGGNGGAGTASSITGSSVTYAAGGGGGAQSDGGTSTGGTGGSSIGGNGATNSTNATNGTANTGSGGGGGGHSSQTVGTGGSGVVILSVPTANYTGTTTGSPTVTTSGSNTIIKWTSGSGSYTA